MRLAILLSIAGIAAMNHQTIFEKADQLINGNQAAEVVAALELRCGEAEGLERRHCEADLRDAFDEGTSDAGTIVRLHCTRFDNGWNEQPVQSAICASIQEG